MGISFLKFKAYILAVLVATVLLLISLFFGIRSGKANAQARIVYETADQLVKGLDNFFSDQDRFPDSAEFANPDILLNYFSRLPYNVSFGAACSENFIYKRAGLTGYQLDFCLTEGANGYLKGWNMLSVQK